MVTKERIHTIISSSIAPGDDELLLLAMRYSDALGRPFECVVRAMSKDHSIDESKVLGDPLVVQYEPAKGQKRFFHGIVSEFSYQGSEGEYGIYEILLRPWLWFLQHTTDSRIFQDMTVRDIIDDVFKKTHGFTDYKFSLTQSYPPRNYCVQYRESDFQFISRLLEEEGIYYFFEHEIGKHMMVLVDDAASHKKIDGENPVPFRRPGDAPAAQKHIKSWMVRSQLHSTSVTTGDYDFEKSTTKLTAQAKVHRKHKMAKLERYDFPGRYTESQEGSRLATVRAQEYQVDYSRYLGVGNEIGIVTGRHFKMEDHPRSDQNAVDFLITSSVVQIESSEVHIFSGQANEFAVNFEAIKKMEQFRSACRTHRPTVVGPQPAVVVGKAGEEIWTDQHGRVKVQFLWDREGTFDENSSCWVRVSSAWAGNGWGSIHTPRIGQEVLVEFIDGDPDRPVVMGRVYNSSQVPPYKLPDNQTQSGIKTRSSKGGTHKTFNELRFEDKHGEEEIYLHAERDFTQVVENNAKIQIGLEGKDKGNQTIEVFNDRSLTLIEGNETIIIEKGNRETIVKKGDESIEIKVGDRSIRVPSGKHLTEAGRLIELKVGSSCIKITPSKITISAPQIEINAQGQTKINGTMTEVGASAVVKIKSAIVKIN